MKDDKEPTDLWISIEIAKIKYSWTHDIHSTVNGTCGIIPKDCIGKLTMFNPFDSATNVELRDEYKVEINYFHKRVIIYNHDTGQTWRVEYEDESQINRAVLICILENVK